MWLTNPPHYLHTNGRRNDAASLPKSWNDGFHGRSSTQMLTILLVVFIVFLFERMFVDALDSEFFWEHHEQGRCPLGSSPAAVLWMRLS
jgi:hypothetical protein